MRRTVLQAVVWLAVLNRSGQFVAFAQNILDRRFALQTVVPGGTFQQYLAEAFTPKDLEGLYRDAREHFDRTTARVNRNPRYAEWLTKAGSKPNAFSFETTIELYTIRRQRTSRKMSRLAD
jgi:hypothetical protein